MPLFGDPFRQPEEEPQDPVKQGPALTLPETPEEFGSRMLTQRRQQQPAPVPQPAPTPGGETPEEFGTRLVLQRRQNKEAELLGAFRLAVKEDPDLVAESRRIAEQLGIKPELAESNIEVAREVVKERALRYRELQQRFPVLLRNLEQVEFVRIAHDDLENLRTTESTYGWASRVVASGRMMNERGYIGVRKALDWASPEELERLVDIGLTMRETLRDTGVMGTTLQLLGQMSGTLPQALATGGAAAGLASFGGPIGAGAAFTYGTSGAVFAQSALIEGGNAYLNMINAGYSPESAKAAALGHAIVAGSLETVGFRFVAAPFKRAFSRGVGTAMAKGLQQRTGGAALATFVKEYAKGFGGETLTEMGQEVSQIVFEELARPEHMTSKFSTVEGWHEFGERIGEVAGKTMKGMLLLAAPGPAAHFISDSIRASQAEQSAKVLDAIIKLEAESKLGERSPEERAKFTGDLKGEVPDVYIDGAKFVEVLKQTGLSRDDVAKVLSPEVMQQVDLQLKMPAAAGDIVIPTEEFTTNLRKSDLQAALLPHVSFGAEQMSAFEAEQFRATEKEDVERVSKEAGEILERDETTAESARKVEDDMRSQLFATGRMSDRDARASAKLYRAFVEVQAARLSETPEQFHAARGLKVVAGEPTTAGVLTKTGEDVEPRAGFAPETLTAMLYRKTDASSFLHESGHYFLTVYGNLAQQENAPAELAQGLQTLLESFGVKDAATWNAMTLEQQRKHHEAFARNFEDYLLTGKAPSVSLQRLFDRFRAWLLRIYKSLRGELNAAHRAEFGEDLPILTPEVRAVFDRMLASQEEIDAMESQRGMMAQFQSQEQAGMTDEQWAAYQDLHQQATDAAITELSKASLRDMRWLSGKRSGLLKKAQKEAAGARAKVREHVAAEVDTMPVYRLKSWLHDGRLTDEEGNVTKTEGSHRLNTEAVSAVLGEEAANLKNATAKNGVLPDVVAPMFGYESGDAMVRDLLAAEPKQDVIEARTDNRMLVEHGELSDPTQRERIMERALHNDARARFVATELRHLSKVRQPVRQMLAAAKEVARQVLANRSVRQIRPRDFSLAEARAAKEVRAALSKGDTAAAIAATHKQLLQNQLTALAVEMREEIDSALEDFAKFAQDDKKLAKSRDVNIIGAGRAILAAHGIGGGSTQARPHLDKVAEYNPPLYEDLRPMVDRATDGARHYLDLPLAEFQALADAMDSLWARSRREKMIEYKGKQEAREYVKALLLAALSKRIPPGPPPGITAAFSPSESRKRTFGSLEAALTHVESWVLKMDGGKAGDLHKYLFSLLREPFNDHMVEKLELVKEINDRARALKMGGPKIAAPRLDYTFKDRSNLLGALLQAGNLGNMRKNLLWRGWATESEDGVLDTSRWWATIQDLVAAGRITEADVDFIQHVWDIFEGLKKRVQEAHYANYGHYMEEVEATPFTLTFKDGTTKTYRGGYFPAKGDPELVGQWSPANPDYGVIKDETSSTPDGIADTSREVAQSRPGTGKGFTITRTNVIRPLAMDLRLVAVSLDEELRFIHMQRAGRDIASLLYDKDISTAIASINPDIMSQMFMPWLKDTLVNRVVAPGGHKALVPILLAARRNTGLAVMFGNVRVAFQQLTGIGISLLYVKLKYLRGGAARYWSSDRGKMMEDIFAASKFMRLRLEKQIGQIRDDMDVILDPTWLGKAGELSQKHAYFLQRMFQNPVDIITWAGAHDQAIAEGRTEEDAVRSADAIVRRSQASGTAPDISKFERGSAHMRLLLQFSSFWIATFNTVTQRHGAERAQAIAMILLTIGIGAGAITKALEGGWEDDDDDGHLWDDVSTWAFGETLKTSAAVFAPVIGPAVVRLATGEFGGRVSFGAAIAQIEKSWRGVRGVSGVLSDEDKKMIGRNVQDVATLLTMLLGLPITLPARPIGYAMDVESGRVEPKSGLDYARGLVTGR